MFLFILYLYGIHRDLHLLTHSFPTRRSSDLLPALLQEDYCPDIHERLGLYKRLASCQTPDDLTVMQEELIDRFGELPDTTRALLAVQDRKSTRLNSSH